MPTSIISVDDYFGPWLTHPDVTPEVMDNALAFLLKVNELLELATRDGIVLDINPRTKNYVAGETYGGFRPQDCPQGAPDSSHKVGRGIDIYDPENELDEWMMLHQYVLKRMGLHIEHPIKTVHWCHVTDRAPKSGLTVFMP